MPNMPLVLTPIETYMPSLDMRSENRAHVIDGENFLFDSKGPKSGFGSDILTPFAVSAPSDFQSLTLEGHVFVLTQDAILEWRRFVPYTWDLIQVFDNPIAPTDRLPWSGVFFAGENWFAQATRGLYRAALDPITRRLVFTSETPDTLTGLIEGVIAMVTVRNRMILVSESALQWSNTAEMYLTPALGGAGFQYISTFAKGTFVALTEFQDGFTIWTTEGSINAEYIGGDAVWRFYPGTSKELPRETNCAIRLASGVHVIMSDHGLFVVQEGQDPKAWTPEFNEFLADYIVQQGKNQNRWRLSYDEDRQIMYVMESNDSEIYWRSFVLTPTRNKWGIFSQAVHGLCKLAPELFGFVGLDGIVRYFNDGYFREVNPGNSLGCDRHYPRVEKGLAQPSSSAVSRAAVFFSSQPTMILDIPAAGWYVPGSDVTAAKQVSGLESWIEIGYAQAPQMIDAIDAFPEIQEINYGSVPEAAPLNAGFATAWNRAYFFEPEEDWNYDLGFTAEDIQEDLLTESGYTDLLYESDGNIDMLYAVNYVATHDSVDEEDWDILTGSEDWGGPVSGLNRLSSELTILSSQDGRTYNELFPQLARFDTESRMMTTIASGTFHKVRIKAFLPFEYFHVKYLGVTFEYGGQLI